MLDIAEVAACDNNSASTVCQFLDYGLADAGSGSRNYGNFLIHLSDLITINGICDICDK
jgi:hypothetical protein